jgi:hypothetical protein
MTEEGLVLPELLEKAGEGDFLRAVAGGGAVVADGDSWPGRV